jgi:hypothetical protein
MRFCALLALSVVAGATSSRPTSCSHIITTTKTFESDTPAGFRPIIGSEASRLGEADAFVDPTSSFSGIPLGPGGNQQSKPSTVGETALQTLALNNSNDSGRSPIRTAPIPSASPQLDACWASTPCMNVINDFAISYDVIGGNLTDRINSKPSGLDEASLAYSNYFCKVKDYGRSVNSSSFGKDTLTMLQHHFKRHCRASDANAILSPMLQASRRKD